MTPTIRPTPGAVEQRSALDSNTPTIDGRRLHGLIPYSVASRDLGGFREIIEPGALADADLRDLIATREHDRSKLLGRHPTTLTVDDRTDGFAWSVELPASPVGEDVRVAVERGDLRSTSWRMVVAPGGDRWDGDVRHVTRIAELRDVTVTAAPAYGDAARAEYRSTPEPAPPAQGQTTPEGSMEEDRNTTTGTTTGGLQVTDRVTVTATTRPRGLAEEFRAAGFPGDTATVAFEVFEDRAVTWTGSADNIQRATGTATPLGQDQRYAWPAFVRVPVDEGATSVDVMTQTARSLASAANVVRAVDATSVKPETGSTLTIVSTPLKQVANVQSGIPNVYLEQAAFNTIVENDLRLALNEGLDKLILDAIAASGFQAPSTDPLLVSIRKAITTIQGNGYNPDTLILTPANAEALDVLVSGLTGGANDYVFGAGNFATDTIFGLRKRISKTIPAATVADASALGKFYSSRVSLARFEENAGKTNTSLVRLETHAVFGVERQAAAVRIAAA
jgi:HK97 family phage prohead protease